MTLRQEAAELAKFLRSVEKYQAAVGAIAKESRCPQCGYGATMNVTAAEHELLLLARKLGQ